MKQGLSHQFVILGDSLPLEQVLFRVFQGLEGWGYFGTECLTTLDRPLPKIEQVCVLLWGDTVYL